MAVIEGDKALVRWCGVSGATQYQIKKKYRKKQWLSGCGNRKRNTIQG